MDKSSCWADKTPLETGLLLILCVATPFLIILILLYILLPMLCVNCSIKCSEICPATSPPAPPPPPPPPSDQRFVNLETEVDVCPVMRHNDTIHHAFVASIIEHIYEDDSNRQRYVCAGAIVTYKWVITGSTCFETEKKNLNIKESIFVRAGSNYWSKGGSVHEVKQILFANNHSNSASIAAINLKLAFPKISSIAPMVLSTKHFIVNHTDLIEMYDWKTNDSLLLPLAFRKKYVKLTKDKLRILPDSQCKLYSKKKEIFCVSPKVEDICSNYSYMSFPVTKANILIGINFGKICDEVSNITVYLIFDTTLVLSWLKDITQR